MIRLNSKQLLDVLGLFDKIDDTLIYYVGSDKIEELVITSVDLMGGEIVEYYYVVLVGKSGDLHQLHIDRETGEIGFAYGIKSNDFCLTEIAARRRQCEMLQETLRLKWERVEELEKEKEKGDD